MLSKILSLIISVSMVITTLPIGSSVSKIFDLTSQQITNSVDGEVDSSVLKNEDMAATTNNNQDFVVEEQANSAQMEFNVSCSAVGANGWTPVVAYDVIISGLHSVSQTAPRTLKASGSDDERWQWTYTASTNENDRGIFYYDKNSANKLGAASGSTSLSTVKFDVTRNKSGAAYGYEIYSEFSFKADNSQYIVSPLKYDFITGLSSHIFTPVPTSLSPDGQPTDAVTYTATGFSAAGWSPNEFVALWYNFKFKIDYIWVDSTQLWNLFNSEANTIKRLNYASYYSASDSAAWNNYLNAYNNAETVLKGGVEQSVINDAYKQLSDAVLGLKGRIIYDKNGGSGTVNTPQVFNLYTDVSASSASNSDPVYTQAVISLASYSELTRSGYKCFGWVNEPTATTEQFPGNSLTVSETMAVSEITLYAGWNPAIYTVKYNTNPPAGKTSTGSIPNQTCAYGTTYNTSVNTFVVSGYKFKSWNTNPAGTGTDYPAGAAFKNLSTTDGATVTLYAIWAADTVDVYFHRNPTQDGSKITITSGFKDSTHLDLAIGSTVDLTKEPYKMIAVGYNHIGWSPNASSTTATFTTSYTVPNSAQTLYAVWQKKTINVLYSTNGGILGSEGFTSSNATVQYNGTVDLPNEDQISRAGYKLTGWRASKADASGTTFFSPGANYTVPDATGTITFTAEWATRSTTYTLHHNNVAGSDKTTTFSGQYGATLNASDFVTPTAMPGYTFTGWFVADGNGYKKYTNPTTFPADDVQLYAGWSMDALSAEIQRFPTDIDEQAIFFSTGELMDYYQEPGKTNAKNELAEAIAVYNADDGILYNYTKIAEADAATAELRTAIDALIETPADYTLVNEYRPYYYEMTLNDPVDEYNDTHRFIYEGVEYDVTKGIFTQSSFKDFESAVQAVVEGRGIKNQAEVTGYAIALIDAYNALMPLEADYTQYNWYLNEALALNTIIGTEATSTDEFLSDTWGLLWYEEGSWYAFFEISMIYSYDIPKNLSILEQESIDNAVADMKAVYEGMMLNPADYSVYDDNGYASQAESVYNDEARYQDEYRKKIFDIWQEIDNTRGQYTLRYDQDTVDKMINQLVGLFEEAQYKSYNLIFMLNDSTDAEAGRETIECVASIKGLAPADPQRDGYLFIGWYTTAEDTADEIGEKIDFAKDIEMGTSDRVLYTRWEKRETLYTLDVSAADSNIYVKLDKNSESSEGNRYINEEVRYGTKVVLRAVSNADNREFMYWKDNRNRIVSYDEVLEFTLEADRYLTAVYSEAEESGYYTVVFVDSILKTVISEQKVAKGKDATAPDISDVYGEYTFIKWNKSFDNVTGNIIVTSVYALSSEIFTITTVIGETTTKETYRYNTPVILTIADSDIPEGKVFAGWSLDNGKTIFSYNREYKFYAYKDITLTAVFSDNKAEAEASVSIETVITENNSESYKAEIMVSRYLPDNFVFVSSGVLLTKKAEFATEDALNFESQTENSNNILLFRTVENSNNGQYKLTAQTSSDNTLYVRGFVVYLDTNTNQVITLYTDIIEEYC